MVEILRSSNSMLAAARLLLGTAVLLTVSAMDSQDGTPVRQPTRDAEVTYTIFQGTNPITQISRWQTSTLRQRIDFPSLHSFMIADGKAKLAYAVNTLSNNVQVVHLKAGLLDGDSSFTPLEETVVAGHRCRFWSVQSKGAHAPDPPQMCLTSDGLVLDIRVAGKEQARARDVRYVPADPKLFLIPPLKNASSQ